MTWVVQVTLATEAQANDLADTLLRFGADLLNVHTYEACPADFMAGQECSLPAGHDGHHA